MCSNYGYCICIGRRVLLILFCVAFSPHFFLYEIHYRFLLLIHQFFLILWIPKCENKHKTIRGKPFRITQLAPKLNEVTFSNMFEIHMEKNKI